MPGVPSRCPSGRFAGITRSKRFIRLHRWRVMFNIEQGNGTVSEIGQGNGLYEPGLYPLVHTAGVREITLIHIAEAMGIHSRR